MNAIRFSAISPSAPAHRAGAWPGPTSFTMRHEREGEYQMHAYNKPEAEAPEQEEVTSVGREVESDPHGDLAVDNLRETVRLQGRAIDLLSASVFELGRSQMRLKENIVELSTRCSELAGVLTSAAMKASAR